MTSETGSRWPTIASLVARAERLHATGTAAIDATSGEQLTYGALADQAWRLGTALRRRGVPAGAVVAVLADNSIELLDAYLGVPAAGLVLLPLNFRLAVDELRYILDDAHVRVLLVSPAHRERGEDAAAGLGVDTIALGDALLDEAPTDAPPTRADDRAYLYYTSGTTGRPKGVVLSHRNVLAGALSGVAATGLGRHDTWLHAGPMFHLADAWAVWGVTWVGGRHVTMRFEPEAAVATIARHRVSRTLLVPTALDMLTGAVVARHERLPALTHLMFGGAAMPPDVYERATDALEAVLVPTYGATETSGLCTALGDPVIETPIDDPRRMRSVGTETPLVEITLTAVQDPAAPVEPGETGEVVVRGPSVMLGYLDQPEATADVLRDGALRTGDLARRDPSGNLSIVDRLKDMIISGGENVYAQEVERVLAHHPAVASVAVVGRPHERWGETVCAVVEVPDGQTVTLEELRDFARRDLAAYKLPRVLELVDQLPRTGSGKVNKGALRAGPRTPQPDRQGATS